MKEAVKLLKRKMTYPMRSEEVLRTPALVITIIYSHCIRNIQLGLVQSLAFYRTDFAFRHIVDGKVYYLADSPFSTFWRL